MFDDEVAALFGARDPMSSMVSIDMVPEKAPRHVFGTVWTHHLFLLPLLRPFSQGTRLAWLRGHGRGVVLLLSRTPFLDMIQSLRFVSEKGWAETTLDLHFPAVMSVIVVFVFFPSFGLKVWTDPTLGVMKRSKPPEVIFQP